jgi:signal transduction histidine kinase
MLKSLRRKFICIAVLSFAAALLLILGIINTVSFANVMVNVDNRIEMLAREYSLFPDGVLSAPPEILFGQDGLFGRGGLSEEARYDSRFFTVTFDEDGTVTVVNTGRIAATDAEEAAAMATTLYVKGKTTGITGVYRYRAVETYSGTMYVFLECSRELDTFYTFLTASCLAAAAGLLVVTLLVVLFSKIAIRPVAESYEKQKRFITDASHELKTPLAVISAANEVTEMETGETEWTQSISKQIARLTSLTEKLVMLSRMDEESYRPTTANFDLSVAVRETVQSFEAVAQIKNKTYTADIENGITFNGDETALRQLTSLLIDNAMKYSDEGGRIEVSLKRSGRNTVLKVFNTVESIQKGSNDVLFERFYRADASRNSDTGGHGIGLSVAKAIVQAHKGRISAVSADGKSILFTVTL